MAEILGKDLDNWDDSLAAREPYSLPEVEPTGAQFMTGTDLIRSATIDSSWKEPVAVYAQAYSPVFKGSQPVLSVGRSLVDVFANLPSNIESMAAQMALENIEEPRKKSWIESVYEGTEFGQAKNIIKGIANAYLGIRANQEQLKSQDEVVDLLNDRNYPLKKYAQRVIANATADVENRRIVRELYNQAQGIDSSTWYNQAGSIIGAMLPAMAVGNLAWSTTRTLGAGRAAATKVAENVAKGFIGAEMAGEYAEETAAQYLQRTGDKNFENFTAKDASGLSALAYGAIGAQIEFMGGVEPIMAGALSKVGLRSGLLKAGAKIAGGEATEELLQGLTETLFRKIEGSTDKTWKEGIEESLKGALWGAVIGGFTGAPAFYVNRRNLVKGIKNVLPTISNQQATMVADAMIDSAGEISTQDPTLRGNLRDKISMMYKDIDMDEKEARIDAITDLEYGLIAMDSAERGIEIAENPLFQGEVTPFGWFREGIPEARRAEIQGYITELTGLQEQLKKLNEAQEKDWDKIDEIETKLNKFNTYVLEKLSDLARADSRQVAKILRDTEQKFVQREKERATKKAIKGGSVDVIADELSKKGFKTRDMSGTQIKELARLNWELLQDIDLGKAQSRGTIQKKLADIEANVESGDRVLERAGYTPEQIAKMDDETWNRAVLTQYRKEAQQVTQPEYTESDLEGVEFQIDATEKISPLKYRDYDYIGKRLWTYDVDGKKHVIESYLVLPDGTPINLLTLAYSRFPNNEVWALYKSEGGESLDYFRYIWTNLIQNMASIIRGKDFGKMDKGTYENLIEADNKKLLLDALEKTKAELTDRNGAEVKAQIAVVDNIIDNIKDGYITPRFNEIVSLSDGTHLVTHGIGGTPESVENFLKAGKVYNPSLYISEKPSEYGYHSVVLFADPSILTRKSARIFDRDAYTTTIGREPTKEIVVMPDEEKARQAMDVFNKYFNLEYNITPGSGSTLGDFAVTMERGLKNIKDDYYFNSIGVAETLVKKYIIADAIERGILDVDKHSNNFS